MKVPVGKRSESVHFYSRTCGSMPLVLEGHHITFQIPFPGIFYVVERCLMKEDFLGHQVGVEMELG